MYNINKNFDFIGVIEVCGLSDLGFYGLNFTWCNHRDVDARIWKWFDREMVNDQWLEIMTYSSMTVFLIQGYTITLCCMRLLREKNL